MKYYLLLFIIVNLVLTQDKELFTCGMHPEVIRKKPGTCPICEMDLIPVKKGSVEKNKERKILFWRAPMDPNEIYHRAGKSKMGMDLVPVYADEMEGVTVQISPALQQNMGIRSVDVKKKNLYKEIQSNGRIVYDERRLFHFALKYEVWIEKLHINFIGQRVKKGQVIMEIYSPELIAAQQEFLTAYKTSKLLSSSKNQFTKHSSKSLLESARKKLKYWNLGGQFISELMRTNRVKETVKIHSPFSGILNKKNIHEGHFAKIGATLFEIADLSKVWVLIDIYEKDLPFISIGQEILVKLPYDHKAGFISKIDYIYPELDMVSRSVKARAVLHNPNEILKINMMANVNIKKDYKREVLTIPEESLILTGRRKLVIVDNRDHSFSPREVAVGHYFNGSYEIVNGLLENEKVVSSAQFLIDSESKLKEAIQKMIAGTETDLETSSFEEKNIKDVSLLSIQCETCVNTISSALEQEKLIKWFKIDLERKRLRVVYNESRITINDIEKIVANTGYHAGNTKRNSEAYENLPECCKEE